MKSLLTLLIITFTCYGMLCAQTTVVMGKIYDGSSNEPLMFANVSCNDSGIASDLDGNYTIELPNGTQEIVFSYVGYEDQIKTVELTGGSMTLDIAMGSSVTLKEIEIVADVAMDRKTPVAFTNIPTKKILEEISGGDIAQMVNTVPGAQYTAQGGGDGDARITIRGFNQRNVAVMIDGIPVNDMENGWVYWSNWFGLDVATKTVQVQRGLGASKLALPSVGGTMNILTRGMESKRRIQLKQQIGDNGFLQTTLGLTSGRMNGGFGVAAAISYKQGRGYVDQNYTQGGFYYLKIDKELGNHILTLSGMGAPQEHGQRSFKTFASIYAPDYAKEKLGFTDEEILEQHYQFYGYGDPNNFLRDSFTMDHFRQDRKYNQHWGEYTTDEGETIRLTERKNFYHKPQFSFRHTWNKNKLFLSNILYASLGNGGGSGTDGNIPRSSGLNDRGTEFFGQRNFQVAYLANRVNQDSTGEFGSSSILRASINNHQWFGALSTLKYEINDRFSFVGGVDLRTYKGEHKRIVYDLLGGDYFNTTRRNANRDPNEKLRVGDQYFYHDFGLVRWGGLFGLLEFEQNKVAAFLNVSTAITGYNVVDHHRPKALNLGDTTLLIGYNDTPTYNGETYDRNSPGLEYQESGWKTIPGFTVKAGAKYNITRQHSVFANLGYLSKAAQFDNVLFGINFYKDYKNEIIQAAELGYKYKSKIFASNLNGYVTNWLNKPETFSYTDQDTGERYSGNINGISAIHSGVELDLAIKPIKMLSVEGLVSIGNWIWNSGGSYQPVDEAGIPVLDSDNNEVEIEFDATGVHVGDAAQTQVGGLVRIEPIKNLYFKVKGTYFGNYYSDFNINTLQGENGGTESWKLPAYTLFSLHTGYSYKLKKGTRFGVRFNVQNLFDTTYVSDALNNDQFLPGQQFNFDAKSASMFVGQGRRWNTSFTITF